MAQKYWVGGSGTWNSTNTTNWSNTSGGSGGASVPGIGDIATFDQAGTHAITVASTAPACDAVSITVNYAFTLSGNVNLGTECSWLQSWGSLDLNGNTLTIGNYFCGGFFSNFVSLAFNGGGIVMPYEDANWTAQENWSYTGTFSVSMTSVTGSFMRSINNTSSFWTESTAISVGVGSGYDIKITAGATDELNFNGVFKNIYLVGHLGNGGKNTASSMTVYGSLTLDSASAFGSLGTSFVFAATSGTQTFTPNGSAFNGAFTVNSPGAKFLVSGAATVSGAVTFSNGTIELTSGATTAVGSFVTSGTTLKYLQATSSGSRATLSDSNGGTNTVTYLSIKDNAAAGTATWNATSATNVNAGNVTGWNFGAPSNTFFLL